MPTSSNKILGLELLRGLCALIVALYHCLTWSDLAHFYSWGLYGVYVFFGISGAVLYANYHASLSLVPGPGQISIGQFLLKRFARLVPLLAACVLFLALMGNNWAADSSFLNLSLLFGFGAPGATSLLTGGWSIGIEVVLYAIFPALLAFAHSVRVAIATLTTLIVLRMALLHFALRGTDFISAWSLHIQPAAFMCFFFGGMLIAKWMPRVDSRYLIVAGLACAAGLFAFPGTAPGSIVLGARGLLLTLLSLAIVAAFFWSPVNRFGAAMATFFGDISYGLYLIHPLVWNASAGWQLSTAAHIALTLVVASAAAWLSLRFYEAPARRFIVNLASRGRAATSATSTSSRSA
jgi:peptidoglycan/LPS O-acetylase OafA/YrhL